MHICTSQVLFRAIKMSVRVRNNAIRNYFVYNTYTTIVRKIINDC